MKSTMSCIFLTIKDNTVFLTIASHSQLPEKYNSTTCIRLDELYVAGRGHRMEYNHTLRKAAMLCPRRWHSGMPEMQMRVFERIGPAAGRVTLSSKHSQQSGGISL